MALKNYEKVLEVLEFFCAEGVRTVTEVSCLSTVSLLLLQYLWSPENPGKSLNFKELFSSLEKS